MPEGVDFAHALLQVQQWKRDVSIAESLEPFGDQIKE
jgi:hypothetical protein